MAPERYVKALANFERLYNVERLRARRINNRLGFLDESYRIELQNYHRDYDVAKTADRLRWLFETPDNARHALAAIGISAYAGGNIATALAISKIDKHSLENILNRMARTKISRRGFIGTAALSLVIATEACTDNSNPFAPDPTNPPSSEPAYLDNIVNSTRELLLGTHIPDKRPVLPNGVLKVYKFDEQRAGTDSTPIAEIPIANGSYKITKDHKLLLPEHSTVSLLIETNEGITRYIHRASLTQAGFEFKGMPLDVIANDGLTGYKYADYQDVAHWYNGMSVRWLKPMVIYIYDVSVFEEASVIPNYPINDHMRTTFARMIDVGNNDPQLYTANFMPGVVKLESQGGYFPDLKDVKNRSLEGAIVVFYSVDSPFGIATAGITRDHEVYLGFMDISTTKIGRPASRAALSLELGEILGDNPFGRVDRVDREGHPNKFSREYASPILYGRYKKHNSSNVPDSDFVALITRSALSDTYTKNINDIITSFTIDSR